METPPFTPGKFASMKAGKLIKDARVARGWSQETLARRVNLSQGAIKKIEDGRTAKSKHLPAIAQELGIDLALLDPALKKKDELMPGDTIGGLAKVPTTAILGHDTLGERDLPVFGVAPDETGTLVLSAEPYTFISRPHNLGGIKNAYAILVVGDSMAKEYREGDIAYVHPHLLARAGDACVFHRESGGTTHSEICYLDKSPGFSDTQWHVSKSNPESSFTLDKKLWPQCCVLVGKQSGR